MWFQLILLDTRILLLIFRADKGKKKALQPITRDYTIHLHKLCHRVTFKRKAPTAIKKIKEFASKAMKTKVRA